MTVLSLLMVVAAAVAFSVALSAVVVVPVYLWAARRLAETTADRLAEVGPTLPDGRLDEAFVEQLRHDGDVDARLLDAIERRQRRAGARRR